MKEMQLRLKGAEREKSLSKRTVQIVGSCSERIDPKINEFSHELVRNLTKHLIENEVVILSTVGGEPLGTNDLSIIYDWDILETTYEYAKSLSFPNKCKHLLKIVSSKRSESKIPETRKKLWNDLKKREIISINHIKSGRAWNAGAHQRQEQEKLSDALIIIGGGEGAEHLCSLYISNGKPVIPLNIPLGSSYNDGFSKEESAGLFLFDQAIDNPKKFIPRADEKTGTKLANLDYNMWENDPNSYAKNIINFLKLFIKPQIFYIRLLNEEYDEYPFVESFFRNIVDYIAEEKNYQIKDMGSSGAEEVFLNLEIFKEINNSTIIIADSTGLRPNCFIETGFAFGLKKKVILTAKKGTDIPFDVNAIDCYFWDPDSKMSIEEKRKTFSDFWDKNIKKPSLVPEIEI